MKITAAPPLLLTVALAFTASVATGQGRIYVMPDGTGDGSSWANATGDLAGEMATAVTGTEIWVAQGTYRPTVCMGGCEDIDRQVSFRLRRGVTVVGGFTGTESAVTEANPDNVTVLSGDIGAPGDPSDNAYTVLFCEDCGADAGISNFTITGGYANRAGDNSTQRGRAGAGVYLDAFDGGVASPTFTDCAVVNNDGTGQGGGVYINGFKSADASPTFAKCLIAFNTAQSDGGGLYVFALRGRSNLTFTDTEIRGNGTVNPGSSGGQSGGGIYVSASEGEARLTLERCLVSRNSTDISTPGFDNGNSSANGGGMYLNAGSGISNLTLTVRNSVISHNSCYSGGAVYNNGGAVAFTNVSVVGNRAMGSGGSGAGLYINGGTAVVTNYLSYGNAVPNNPGAGRDLRFVNGVLDISYALLESSGRDDAFSCSKKDCVNDEFNEGPGMIYGQDPMFVDGEVDVPELQATSPALNAGTNALAPLLGGDYFGSERIEDGVVDLGAVERSTGSLPVELLSFTAQAAGATVQVSWASASEVDLGSYRVLRSASGDAGDFGEVGEVLAMGGGEYAYTDRTALADVTYYYRLRSVDLDGTTYDSEIVSVSLEGERDALAQVFTRVYPNPTAGEVRVELAPRPGARTVYATLFDATGRKLRLWPLVTDGEHVLSLRDVPDGQYVLRLVAGGREQSATLLVHH